MFGIHTQFGLSSNYSYNKNCSIPYFINLISDRAKFAVNGPTSVIAMYQIFVEKYKIIIILIIIWENKKNCLQSWRVRKRWITCRYIHGKRFYLHIPIYSVVSYKSAHLTFELTREGWRSPQLYRLQVCMMHNWHVHSAYVSMYE